MGIFYKTAPLTPAVSEALREAFAKEPESVGDLHTAANQKAGAVAAQVAGQFSWGRLAAAGALLVILFVGAIYTGHDDKLQDLYKVLVHGFELLLGAILGIVTGETVAQPR